MIIKEIVKSKNICGIININFREEIEWLKIFGGVRLGAVRKGYNRFEKVFNLCKSQKPPCIAVGWGDIDLSQDIDEIIFAYEFIYDESFKENGEQIRRWVRMKAGSHGEPGDHVIAMIRPAMICGIGEIIKERYYKEDEDFIIEIEGYDNPGEVKFFNRIDVKWSSDTDKKMKVKSLGLLERIENILLQRVTIIELEKDDYDLIKNNIDNYDEPDERNNPKFTRKYDDYK